MKDKDLVLHYVHEFSPMSQTFVYDLVEYQRKQGLNNCVITKRRVNSRNRPFADVTEIGGSRFIPPSKLRALYDIPFLYQLLSDYKGLEQAIRDRGPGIIHCHFGWAALDVIGALTRNKLDIPILVSLHGTDVTFFPQISKKYVSLLQEYNISSLKFTVPSEYLKYKAVVNLEIDPDRINVVPNCINFGLFAESKAIDHEPRFTDINSDREKNLVKIACIARFVRWKGHHLLVDTAKYLLESGYCFRFILIGEGGEKTKVEQLVNTSGLEEYFEFLGAIEHRDIPKILNECDLYVQPSIEDPATEQAESFGISVVEALAIGLPVVVTNTGGLPDTVKGLSESQAMIASANAESLVLSISKAIDNVPNKVDKNALFTWARERYSQRNHCEKIVGLYSELGL